MRRRILVAIIGVTALASLVLTLPLALLIANREHDDANEELTLAAERAANELTSDSDFANSALDLPHFEHSLTVGVYLPDGRRVTGDGPTHVDRFAASARLLTITGSSGTERLLARPIVERERQVAVIRVAEPLSESERKIWRDILVLLAIDLGAVGIAAIVGSFVARRLVRPLTAIRDDAVRLGDGDFTIVPAPSGIDELDATANALAETAARLDGVLRRERAFTADASHQLRTPLTSLRLGIESEMQAPGPDPMPVYASALNEVDRLEATITTLLRVARDQPISREPLDITQWLDDLSQRWVATLATRGRALAHSSRVVGNPRVSGHVLDQIVDILVSNSVEHGAGLVQVDLAEDGSSLSVTVADRGRLDRDPATMFTRRDPGATGHGLGLALARSLAEAEGGRLVLVESDPTTFRVLLPDAARQLEEIAGSR